MTAPLRVRATVKMTMAQYLLYPKKIRRMNIRPGVATANVVKLCENHLQLGFERQSTTFAKQTFLATTVDILPVFLKWSARYEAVTDMAYLPK